MLDIAETQWHQPDALARTPGAPNAVRKALRMKTFLLRFFTWWNGQTFGTQVWTSLYGELVGEDEFGNRYYRTKGGKIDPTLGFERRWVIYNGVAEALDCAAVLAWLAASHRRRAADAGEGHAAPWWKPHRPNLTGTPGAHRPTGSTLAQGRRPEGDRRLQGLAAGAMSGQGAVRPSP